MGIDAFERDKYVVICNKPEHTKTVVEDSHKTRCADCGAVVWIAPSSVELLGRAQSNGHKAKAICCCCADVHSTTDLSKPHPKYGPLHTHQWDDDSRVCVCGMTHEQFREELLGPRKETQ